MLWSFLIARSGIVASHSWSSEAKLNIVSVLARGYKVDKHGKEVFEKNKMCNWNMLKQKFLELKLYYRRINRPNTMQRKMFAI
jgi:hypothetical protein